MAGGNLSPRQKMINMMYLVLIALLALNVSAEILKAFFLVESSFNKTSKNIDERNKQILAALSKEVDKQGEKAKPFYDAAKSVDAKVAEFVKYVDGVKKELEERTGGRMPVEGDNTPWKWTNEPKTQLMGRDNMEIHANYLINEKHGEEFKKKVNALNADLTNLAKSKGIDVKGLLSLKELEAKDDPKHAPETWEEELFEHAPLAAVITLMTKMQNDAKNAGSEIMAELGKAINAADFKFDALVCKIIPKSTMVLAGEKFEADILLAAYNSKQDNVMSFNGTSVKVEKGVGKYTESSSVGTHKYKASIQVKGPDGSVKTYEDEGEYIGFNASATISADKMNVLYVGLENPLSVSVGGARAEDVQATFSAGASARMDKPGHYIVEVSATTREVTVTASVKGKTMGAMKFRVKNVPKPFPLFGNKESGRIAAAEVPIQQLIYCGLGPEFLFDGMKYSVTKYTLIFVPRKQDPQTFQESGQLLTPRVKAALSKVRKGDQILVTGIEALGPGKVGLVRVPAGIALTVE